MIRRPPRSTLFPYTTLFRSEQFDAALARLGELGDESSLPLLLRWRAYASWLAGDWDGAVRDAETGHDAAVQTGQPDRKSTRLNSRPSQISSAVFCLKKKKHQ